MAKKINLNELHPDPITIEHANILPGMFRNFEGRESQYNQAGNRNFMVQIPEDEAQKLIDDGWHINEHLNPQTEQVEYRLKVKVRWSDNVKPENDRLKIWLVYPTKKTMTLITPENASVLDFADIENADITVRAYHYNFNGNEGNSAYLNEAYITLVPSDLAGKYDGYSVSHDAPTDETSTGSLDDDKDIPF